MNNITISGFLGRESEVRTTKTGKTVSNLTVAHTPREKRGDEWVDSETVWLKVSVWDDLPPIMYAKGTRVVVSGQLNVETFEKKGVTRQNLVVKNATVGLVHKFNTNTPVTATVTEPVLTDPWASAPLDEEAPF